MPEPSSTPTRPDDLQAVHEAEASRLADRLSTTFYCTDAVAEALLVEGKIRAHRTISAEDLLGLREGSVLRCANGYIHMVRYGGHLESLTLGQGPVAPAFPATVLMEAGDDL
jgi:hypothetical protein